MTEVTVSIGAYRADISAPLDISIPVQFGTEQLRAFGGPSARREAFTADGFTGDVRRGGSCNCEIYCFSPHLNGTHTECVGHVTAAHLDVCALLGESLLPATLVTVAPVPGAECGENYDPALREGDMTVTATALKKALAPHPAEFLAALIVRTLPNDPGKRLRDYGREPPAFFSNGAMEFIVGLGVRHLLADMPSVDRADDEGKLTNHRIFWGLPRGAAEAAEPSRKTITELVYAPDALADGPYLLNLQVAAFSADAAPSRPVLYRVSKK